MLQIKFHGDLHWGHNICPQINYVLGQDTRNMYTKIFWWSSAQAHKSLKLMDAYKTYLMFTHYWNNIILQLDQVPVVWCLSGLFLLLLWSFIAGEISYTGDSNTPGHVKPYCGNKKIHRDRLKEHNNQSKQAHKSISNGTCRSSSGFSVSFKGDGDVHIKTSTLWCPPWTSFSQNEPQCLSALPWQSWKSSVREKK